MDFKQQKLRREDWEAIEVPASPNEQRVLDMIKAYGLGEGESSPSILSLLSFMRLLQGSDKRALGGMHTHLFNAYLQPHVAHKIKRAQKKRLSHPSVLAQTAVSKHTVLKKADIIRMGNTENRVSDDADGIYECILINVLFNCYGTEDVQNANSIYTLEHLLALNIPNSNPHVERYCERELATLKTSIPGLMKCLVEHADECIEQNIMIARTRPLDMYLHQKELVDVVGRSGPKLVFYQAPTGTGKTLSPIAIAQKHPTIFVCAAKHVGLQLAKASVSAHLPIAIAFGCSSPKDVRLHYFSAKDYTRNYKSGGIFRVDHDVGDKVQLMISDVTSYIHAMHYLSAFNPPETVVMYWDEPTISLDYPSHDFHPIIRDIWSSNIVQNIVLSSATLPQAHEIPATVADLRRKFSGLTTISITSSECTRTIPILSPTGDTLVPHALYPNYTRASACAQHCRECPTVTRHLGLRDVGDLIREAQPYLPEELRLERVFTSCIDITASSLKTYYLNVIDNIPEDNWAGVCASIAAVKRTPYPSTVMLTTTDAYTITSGPAIYLCDDPGKIARFCIQSAEIPEGILDDLFSRLQHNDKSRDEIAKLNQIVQGDGGKADEKAERKNSKLIGDMGESSTKHAIQKITRLEAGLKSASLEECYVPNTPEHMYKHLKQQVSGVFSSDIPEHVVQKIVGTSADPMWKILMLMGIGVFIDGIDQDYLNIMRQLAYEQRLFCIIASSDYIYGTNYQFCHGYIGKDLTGMTAEKMIQALGRVGRGNSNVGYTVRLRDTKAVHKVFLPARDKPEVQNMNALFRC
jgi:hypothetical protein